MEGPRPASDPEDLARSVLPDIPGTFYVSTLPPERRIIDLTPGWDELLDGVTGAEVDARPALADLIHPGDRPRVEREIRDSIDESGAYGVVYRLVPRVSGPRLASRARSRWVWDRGRVTGEGDDRCIHGLLLDITELKSVEDRAIQGQRKEALGALAGSVAQEFNDLLTAIYGSLDLARVQTDIPAAARDEIHVATQAVRRARNLTEQLVSFTRSQAQRPKLANPNDLLESMKSFIESVAGSSVRTVLALDPAASEASFDPGLLEQAVMNLVLNAREAMEESGGRLLVSTGDVVLEADDVRAGSEVRPGRFTTITVSDTGPGVERDVRHRIYEPFFSTKEGHSGLGLSAAFGIVRQSGGVLRIQSAPGEGTRATIFLPAAGGGASASPAAAAPGDRAVPEPSSRTDSAGDHRGRILVVEDDEAVRRLLVRILTRGGYEVVDAGRGEEALELVAEDREGFDLLLTDVMLPGSKGPALARSIALHEPEARVLFVSGFADDPELRRSGLPDASVFLAKPFTIEEVLAAVEEALQQPPPTFPDTPAGTWSSDTESSNTESSNTG